MSLSSWVFGYRLALSGALVALSCQHDTQAIFDSSEPPSDGGTSAVAGSAADAAGGEDSPAAGGEDAAGGPGGGSTGEGGGSTSAGQGGSAGGMGGTLGRAGSSAEAGKAGSGVAGGGAGGSGGTKPDPEPEPVTVEITEFADSHIAACYENTNFGTAELLSIDGDYCSYQALLSPVLTQIPAGAEVTAATLTLVCENEGGQLGVSYVEEAWKEDTVRYSNRPEVGAAIGNLTCAEVGAISLELTAVLRAWVSGAHEPYGVYLRSEAENGTDFVSSEGDDVEDRPRLSVTYVPAPK